jgi:hypothetical protein
MDTRNRSRTLGESGAAHLEYPGPVAYRHAQSRVLPRPGARPPLPHPWPHWRRSRRLPLPPLRHRLMPRISTLTRIVRRLWRSAPHRISQRLLGLRPRGVPQVLAGQRLPCVRRGAPPGRRLHRGDQRRRLSRRRRRLGRQHLRRRLRQDRDRRGAQRRERGRRPRVRRANLDHVRGRAAPAAVHGIVCAIGQAPCRAARCLTGRPRLGLAVVGVAALASVLQRRLAAWALAGLRGGAGGVAGLGRGRAAAAAARADGARGGGHVFRGRAAGEGEVPAYVCTRKFTPVGVTGFDETGFDKVGFDEAGSDETDDISRCLRMCTREETH